MKKVLYSTEQLKGDLIEIIREMTVNDHFIPDIIFGPARGACVPGTMLSHYFDVPFYSFEWQTRDGLNRDLAGLDRIASKYKWPQRVLLIDDINDTGTTLTGIHSVVGKYEHLRTAVLFNKESSQFHDVDYAANIIAPEDDGNWIIFPYENWWQ